MLGQVLLGWDVKDIRLRFDAASGEMHIGINCFGVCSDGDGNGLPDVTSPELMSLGGVDEANLARTEGVLVSLDFDVATPQIDYIIGVPYENVGLFQFPCVAFGTTDNTDQQCLGVYLEAPGNGANKPFNTKYDPNHPLFGGGVVQPKEFVVDRNASPTPNNPDLEWSIVDFDLLHHASVETGSIGVGFYSGTHTHVD